MTLSIAIATDEHSWFRSHVQRMVEHWQDQGHEVTVIHRAGDIPRADVAFLLSFGQLVPAEIRARTRATVVVHASALPHGKGWSPWAWQILEGESTIPLTLFEAVDKVDAGPIYMSGDVGLDGTELIDEIRAALGGGIADLCYRFIDEYPQVLGRGREQPTDGESFYRLRTPEDSRLDATKSLEEQFDLIRICDPERYPAFVDIRGERYAIRVQRWRDVD